MKLERKPITGYEDTYWLDPDTMSVINVKRNKALKPRISTKGYPSVQLWKNNKAKHKDLHRLFSEEYIDNPEGYKYINHKDETRTNYSLDNLEWCTQSYNQNYGTVNERRGRKISETKKGVPQPWVSEYKKVPIIAIDPYGNEIRYDGAVDAAEDLNMRVKSIRDVTCGKRRTLYGYRFKYADK